MTETTVTASGGSDQQAAGGADGNTDSTQSTSNSPVSYEAHRRLLTEKKKKEEELRVKDELLAKYELENKERIENELKAKEDYKKLLEMRDKEIQEKDHKLKSIETEIQESAKFSAFLEAIPGQVPKKYWQMIDTAQIVIDPTTGQPDPGSVKKAAEFFQNTYGELIVNPGRAKMPNQAASGPVEPMTEELWKSLSPKEKKQRLPDYVASLKQQRGK